MNKYFGRGEVVFSSTLAYFLTWTNALRLEMWGWREVGVLVWAALFNFVLVSALLWVATRFTKHPIFGQRKAFYFPYKSMLLVSVIASALFGGINYIGDDLPMTTPHILVYLIGFVLGIVVQMACYYQLTQKKK